MLFVRRMNLISNAQHFFVAITVGLPMPLPLSPLLPLPESIHI